MSKLTLKLTLIVCAIILSLSIANAQEKKVAPAYKQLFSEIAHMDSVLFNAYNTQDLRTFKLLFTDNLEWFQDNGGLLSAKTVFETMEVNFKKKSTLTRELVAGSLEVHPIKDYGAIEIGSHQFKHMENGKEEVGTFKFMMIWKNTDSGWKVSKVISYDH